MAAADRNTPTAEQRRITQGAPGLGTRQHPSASSLERTAHTWITTRDRAITLGARLADVQGKLGAALRKTREDSGLSRADVSRKTAEKLTVAKIAGMELGHRFSDDDLVILLEALGMSRLEAQPPRYHRAA